MSERRSQRGTRRRFRYRIVGAARGRELVPVLGRRLSPADLARIDGIGSERRVERAAPARNLPRAAS